MRTVGVVALHTPWLFRPRAENSWDKKSVGSNGVPIETEHGWLLLNHGYGPDHVYYLGVVLLDLDDPTRVINRPKEPIFWPEELWELRGDVPNARLDLSLDPQVDHEAGGQVLTESQRHSFDGGHRSVAITGS